MTKGELYQIKKIASKYVHNGGGYKGLFDKEIPINDKTIYTWYSNYRVVGESKYYCLSKDNIIFEKYKAYKVKVDTRRLNRVFKFRTKGGTIEIYPKDLGKYFYSDIDLYFEGNLEMFNCKSDGERMCFIRSKKIQKCLTE